MLQYFPNSSSSFLKTDFTVSNRTLQKGTFQIPPPCLIAIAKQFFLTEISTDNVFKVKNFTVLTPL